MFKNVIFIGPQFKNPRGGIGQVLSTYAQNIDEFKFIASYNSFYSLPKNILFFINAFIALIKRLRIDKEIEIVHLHGNLKGSFYRMYILFFVSKIFFRKKVIYHYHAGERFKVFYDESGWFIKCLLRHLLKKSDVFICLSNTLYDFFRTNYKVNSIRVLYNPVSLPNLTEIKTLRRNRLYLLFLGRIVEPKGIFDLLKVMMTYRDQFKGKVVLHIGGSDNSGKVAKLIRENNLEEYIVFEGWVNGSNKERLLSKCDVLVLPSYREGLPISILEAMSYGKAIVSTKVGAIPDIVKDHKNGFLINPGDIERLKEVLDQLIKRPDMVKQMGIVSKGYIEEYLVSNVMTELKEIYRSI